VTTLEERLADYLALRRALGFKLKTSGRELGQLVAHVQAAGSPVLTVDLIVEWAQTSRSAAPITWAHRIGAARKFATYLATIDPATQIPPRGLLAARQVRSAPYLWSPGDIAALVHAAGQLSPQMRGATHQTLLGLLAATGMRIGEALRLHRGDADLERGVLTIRESKHGRSRLVPLHPTTTDALHRYATIRDRRLPARDCEAFFVHASGTALAYSQVCEVFVALTRDLGLRTETVHPHIHGLRHTFAVNTLIGWYREGADVGARIAVLSDYLGHVSPAGTYWYLSAVPELMELAAARLETRFGVPR
jgi:integrase/recombinase XerD